MGCLASAVQKREGALVWLAGKEGVQGPGEDVVGRLLVKERQAGAQLHRIDGAEDLIWRALPGPGEQRLDALAESMAEDWVLEISASLIERGDAVILSGGTVAEAGELRENKPHPVALLAPGMELGERRFEDAGLDIDEALEIVVIGHAGIMGLGPPAEKSRSRYC